MAKAGEVERIEKRKADKEQGMALLECIFWK